MTQPFVPLLAQSFRSWMSTRGFVLVMTASLVPLLLTGAWVATHRDDVAAGEITGIPDSIREGDNVTFSSTITNVGGTRVGSFNATLAVGSVFAGRLTPRASETVAIDGLGEGESRTITLSWTATPGLYYVLADADTDDAIGEVEEFNNQEPVPIAVGYKRPAIEDGPAAPANLTGNLSASAPADLRVSDLVLGTPRGAQAHNFSVTVTNAGPDPVTDAAVTLRVVRMFGDTPAPVVANDTRVTLGAGESTTVRLAWVARDGGYYLEAFANATDARDGDGANNHALDSFTVDPVVTPDMEPLEPEEMITIKDFYLDVLSLLHLRILIPFIALFYAGGVIADERERGSLAYLFTRPVQRWLVPLTRFFASFLVAAVAIVIGVVLTYALLFGTVPEGKDVGYLTTPLFATVIALFVYGAFFTLLGTLVERPYLVGAAFVIVWETLAALLVPWVRNLTLSQHLFNAINGWSLDEGVQWLPDGPDGARALRVIFVAAIVFLGLAAVVVKRKEFEL